jgi:hypothetical protein
VPRVVASGKAAASGELGIRSRTTCRRVTRRGPRARSASSGAARRATRVPEPWRAESRPSSTPTPSPWGPGDLRPRIQIGPGVTGGRLVGVGLQHPGVFAPQLERHVRVEEARLDRGVFQQSDGSGMAGCREGEADVDQRGPVQASDVGDRWPGRLGGFTGRLRPEPTSSRWYRRAMLSAFIPGKDMRPVLLGPLIKNYKMVAGWPVRRTTG